MHNFGRYPRRGIAMSYPAAGHTYRKQLRAGSTDIALSVSPNGATRTGGSVQGLSWNSTGRYSGRSGSGTFVRSDTGRWTAAKQ